MYYKLFIKCYYENDLLKIVVISQSIVGTTKVITKRVTSETTNSKG